MRLGVSDLVEDVARPDVRVGSDGIYHESGEIGYHHGHHEKIGKAIAIIS
jgi:hypothetical protein